MPETLWEREPGCTCVVGLAEDGAALMRTQVDECPRHGVLGSVPKAALDKALEAAVRAAGQSPETRGIAPERIAKLLWAAAPYVKEWVAAEIAAQQGGG